MKIRQQLVPLVRRRQYLGTNPRTHITVHEKGNCSAGANAAGHANYLAGSGRPKSNSWHYTVDDKEAVQSYPDTARCFHSGGGKDTGNMSSIAIEICVNSDGDFAQAVDNAIELVRVLMARHNIPVSNVVQHNHWSGKNCPTNIRGGQHGVTWSQFLDRLRDGTSPKPAPATKPVSKPSPKPATGAQLKVDGYWGSATTRALQRVLGTTTDGIVSSQSTHWRRSNPGLTSGWEWVGNPRGSRVIIAMQRRLDVKADGLIGPATINALSTRYGIKGDGRLDGPSITVRAMQRALNDNRF